MARGNRRERRDIGRLYSYGMRYVYEADPEWNQYFCETEKAWELWGPILDKDASPIRIKRWPKTRISFAFEW